MLCLDGAPLCLTPFVPIPPPSSSVVTPLSTMPWILPLSLDGACFLVFSGLQGVDISSKQASHSLISTHANGYRCHNVFITQLVHQSETEEMHSSGSEASP
ncbi:hypothetical protein AVEN_170843-1 [Araneus ventricosus]|uniref:Uncharacterized protein n=1 Tax=Araneus ventricosus TaxID=182803 RepID=A0A4Y2HTE9_ARAVE|nr:hypothetical protein AVEN_170843-1 [Araneus ventricosus]